MQLVVIGGVAAGLSAAARARKLDARMDITVLEKGDTISQGLCGLPYYVENRVTQWTQLVRYTPESFARERSVEVRTGAEVTGIHHGQRRVTLASEKRSATIAWWWPPVRAPFETWTAPTSRTSSRCNRSTMPAGSSRSSSSAGRAAGW